MFTRPTSCRSALFWSIVLLLACASSCKDEQAPAPAGPAQAPAGAPSGPPPTGKPRTGKMHVRVLEDPGPPNLVRVLDPADGREVGRIVDGEIQGELRPGRYQLAVRHHAYESSEVVFPKQVDLRETDESFPPITTGVRLKVAKWARMPDKWELVRVERPDAAVQAQPGKLSEMAVPPGEYRLAILPINYKSRRVVWPQPVVVGESGVTEVTLDSGVAPPEALVRAMEKPPYQWAVWRGNEVLQHAEESWEPLLVPPGGYRWSCQPVSYRSKPAKLGNVGVKAGELATPAAPAVVELRPAEWSGKPSAWSLATPGTREPAQTMTDGELGPAVVAAGEYELRVHPDRYKTSEIVIGAPFPLDAGATRTLELNTGLDVQPSEQAEPPDLIVYTRDGEKEPVQRWSEPPAWRPQLLPPGKYRVAIHPDRYDSEVVAWPTVVEVKEGQLARLTIDSGIRLTLAEGLKPEFGFQITADGKTVQHGNKRVGINWLPPGTYAVQVRPREYTPWQMLKEKVVVEAGKVTEVKITELPKEGAGG